MRGRDAVRKSTQGEHCTGIHDRFLRDPIYRESQLAIGWTEQKYKEWDELAKEDHTHHLTPEEKRRYQGQWYLTLNKKKAKMGLWCVDPIFELLSLWKIVCTTSLANKFKCLFLQNNTGYSIPLQAHRGGTSLNGIGSEVIRIFNWSSFCHSWFRLQSMAIHCNRRGV